MTDTRILLSPSGLLPRIQSRLHSEVILKKARNVNLRHGDIRPWPCPEVVCEHDFYIETLIETPECKCVALDECADIQRFAMSDRPGCDFMIWTGPTMSPRIATVDDFCAGESCKLGIECPGVPEVVSVDPGTEECNCNFASYLITYEDKYGREGPPSEATSPVSIGLNGQACIDLPQPTDPCIERIVIYRLFTGYKTGNEERTIDQTSYHKVAVVDVGTGQYCDNGNFNNGDAILETHGYFAPPNLEGIALLHNGALAGFRDNIIYFSEPGQTQAWTRERDLVLDDKIQKIIPYGKDFFVLTDANPYFVYTRLEDEGYWYQWEKVEEKLPMVSKRGCTMNSNGVFWISKYGLVHMYRDRNNTVTTMLSRNFWDSDDWCKLQPENMCLANFDGRLFMFNAQHPEEDRKTGYIFDYPNQNYAQEGGITEYDLVTPQACYCTPDGRLLMAEGGKVYEWNPCGSTKGCAKCCPYEVEYSNIRMRGRNRWNAAMLMMRDGDTEFKYRRNECHGKCVDDWDTCRIDHCDPFWLSSQGKAHDFEVRVCGCGIIEGLILGTSKQALLRGGQQQ